MIITGCGGELDGSSLYRLRNNQGAPVIIPDGTKIGLIAENSDDIWTLYNLIEPKDFVETTTVRYTLTSSSLAPFMRSFSLIFDTGIQSF